MIRATVPAIVTIGNEVQNSDVIVLYSNDLIGEKRNENNHRNRLLWRLSVLQLEKT